MPLLEWTARGARIRDLENELAVQRGAAEGYRSALDRHRSDIRRLEKDRDFWREKAVVVPGTRGEPNTSARIIHNHAAKDEPEKVDRGIGCWPPYGMMAGDEGYREAEDPPYTIGGMTPDEMRREAEVVEKIAARYGDPDAARFAINDYRDALSDAVRPRWRVIVRMLPVDADTAAQTLTGRWTSGDVDAEAHGEWLTNRLSHEAPWVSIGTHDGGATVVHVEDIDYITVEKES